MKSDVLIIGAGQQGLALARALQKRGTDVVIVDAHERVGDSWRAHYDSLVLFTPRRYSALPGLSLLGDPDGYATKDEFADYLERYVQHFSLPVHTSVRVTNLTDGFKAETTAGIYEAKKVIIATGATIPFIPPHSFTGVSLHSSLYKNPKQIEGTNVLIVGNGNSAAQIAIELSGSKEVHIAMREMPRMIPRKVLGKSYFWWSELLGLSKLPRMKDYVVSFDLLHALEKGALKRKPGMKDASQSVVTFEDDSKEEYDTIIYATGFTSDRSWLHIPNAEKEQRGVSIVPGLFYAGLRNQLAGDSSNIIGAGRVARYLEKRISG